MNIRPRSSATWPDGPGSLSIRIGIGASDFKAPKAIAMSLAQRVAKNVAQTYRQTIHQIRPQTHDSLLFVTLHKCASSLFASELLPNAIHHRQINYAEKLYRGTAPNAFEFPSKGCVFGPIRVSSTPMTPDYERFFALFTDEFLADKRSVFLVRDPRDILVSEFYSFGFTHAISKDPSVANYQLTNRERIQQQDVDSYAIDAAGNLRDRFQIILRMYRASGQKLLLRYEDLVLDPDRFMDQFCEVCPIPERVRQQAIAHSRPRTREDTSAHRRSGAVGGFREKLRPTTIARLDMVFSEILENLGYQQRRAMAA